MATDTTNAKIYTHGAIGRGLEISDIFQMHGAKNPMAYKFGDPDAIYYINQLNNVEMALPGSDIYYILTNSDDWAEINLKHSKKVRKFHIMIKEGSSNCSECRLYSKKSDCDRSLCELAKSLQNIADCGELAGHTLYIEDLSFEKPLPQNED